MTHLEKERTLALRASVCVLFAIWFMAAEARAQYIHSRSPPTASDFPHPPTGTGLNWRGPSIKQLPARCWYAEPRAPNVPIGGTSEVQALSSFHPIVTNSARTVRQTDLSALAGGGWQTPLKSDDLPSGVYVAVRAHPVFRVTKIEHPARGIDFSEGRNRTGVQITAEFLHTPTMGECYFYAAVWVLE